jgi:hypothetical protein
MRQGSPADKEIYDLLRTIEERWVRLSFALQHTLQSYRAKTDTTTQLEEKELQLLREDTLNRFSFVRDERQEAAKCIDKLLLICKRQRPNSWQERLGRLLRFHELMRQMETALIWTELDRQDFMTRFKAKSSRGKSKKGKSKKSRHYEDYFTQVISRQLTRLERFGYLEADKTEQRSTPYSPGPNLFDESPQFLKVKRRVLETTALDTYTRRGISCLGLEKIKNREITGELIDQLRDAVEPILMGWIDRNQELTGMKRDLLEAARGVENEKANDLVLTHDERILRPVSKAETGAMEQRIKALRDRMDSVRFPIFIIDVNHLGPVGPRELTPLERATRDKLKNAVRDSKEKMLKKHPEFKDMV